MAGTLSGACESAVAGVRLEMVIMEVLVLIYIHFLLWPSTNVLAQFAKNGRFEKRHLYLQTFFDFDFDFAARGSSGRNRGMDQSAEDSTRRPRFGHCPLMLCVEIRLTKRNELDYLRGY